MGLLDLLTMIPPGSKCVLIGTRNTGKTYLIRHLLCTLGLTRNVHVQSTAQKYHDLLRLPTANRLLQESTFEEEYNEVALKQHLDANDCSAIVLDDFMYSPEWAETETFHRLMTQKTATVFVTLLYGMDLPESIRERFDVRFFFRTTIESNLTRLFELYCSPGLFPTQDAFRVMMKEVTDTPHDENDVWRFIEGACLAVTTDRVLRYIAPKYFSPLIQDDVTTRRWGKTIKLEVKKVRYEQNQA